MSVSLTQLLSSSVFARNGRAGSLSDVLFDESTWRVRWLVVETGPWLFGHEVLIRPDSLLDFDEGEGRVSLDLTLEQIECAPDIRSDPPFHLQREGTITYEEVMAFTPGSYGVVYVPPRMPVSSSPRYAGISDRTGDPHLWSAAEVLGYQIDATDGRLGFLKDLRFSAHLSHIETGIVQTGRWWWPRQELHIDRHAISHIDWPQQRLAVKMPRQASSSGRASIQGRPARNAPFSLGAEGGLGRAGVSA